MMLENYQIQILMKNTMLPSWNRLSKKDLAVLLIVYGITRKMNLTLFTMSGLSLRISLYIAKILESILGMQKKPWAVGEVTVRIWPYL